MKKLTIKFETISNLSKVKGGSEIPTIFPASEAGHCPSKACK